LENENEKLEKENKTMKETGVTAYAGCTTGATDTGTIPTSTATTTTVYKAPRLPEGEHYPVCVPRTPSARPVTADFLKWIYFMMCWLFSTSFSLVFNMMMTARRLGAGALEISFSHTNRVAVVNFMMQFLAAGVLLFG
jgi:hypothetical protein